MKPRFFSRLTLAATLLATAAILKAAVVAGSAVYAKRFETSLLAEPQPLAKPNAKITVGRKLKVDEVRGVWLRVSDGPTAGWVFAGNVSDTKPAEIKGLDGLPIEASKTTATAAGRAIDDVAKEYAERHNLNSAYDDLDWMGHQCRELTNEELEDFLQKQKKGEYQ